MSEKALVLFSGGQDSTTCLFWAIHKYGMENVEAFTVNYGQKHEVEVAAAEKVLQLAGVNGELLIVPDKTLLGESPLLSTNDNSVGKYESADELPGGIEPTFVPGRNIMFLTLAANRAYVGGFNTIVTGVCEEDYGGYPDCRDMFISAMQNALNFGLYGEAYGEDYISIRTPLMKLTKKQTVEMAVQLPGCWYALGHSHTCYNGVTPPCGKCHSCILRARGFEEAGMIDPLIERLNIQ